VLWERGDGVPPDPVEARSWYARAAAQGIEPARTALERLDAIAAGRGRPLEEPSVSAAPPARAAGRPNPPAAPPRSPAPPKE